MASSLAVSDVNVFQSLNFDVTQNHVGKLACSVDFRFVKCVYIIPGEKLTRPSPHLEALPFSKCVTRSDVKAGVSSATWDSSDAQRKHPSLG